MADVIRADGLRKRYGKVQALDGLDLAVPEGTILALLGPNGSGKTTALNLISGVLRPDFGTIRFSGQPIEGLPAHRIARLGLARTFQLVRVLNGMNCADNVKAGLAFHKPYLGRAEIDDTASFRKKGLVKGCKPY